jgi:tetratricopeptide (TPR) repeat protein
MNLPKLRDIFLNKAGEMLQLLRRRGANRRCIFKAALPLLAVLFLPLANSYSSLAAAATSIPDNTSTTGDTDAYLAQLRKVLPQSWLQREFQRQRSFPAFARSRQLVAKGQYEEAFQELETYLASDPEDLVIQFGYLILASDLKRYRAAIGAADRILAGVPTSHLHYFTVGLLGRPWARIKKLCQISPPR